MKKSFIRVASFILVCAVVLSLGLALVGCSQPDNRPEWEKRWSAIFEENIGIEYISVSSKKDLMEAGLYGPSHFIGPDDTHLPLSSGGANDEKKEQILAFFRNSNLEFEKNDAKIDYKKVYCMVNVIIDSTLYKDSEGNLSFDELGYICKSFCFYVYEDGYVYIPAKDEVYKSQTAINIDELNVFD